MPDLAGYDKTAVLDLLQVLVNTDTGTGNGEGLAKAAAVAKVCLERLQFSWETLQGCDGSLHYCARRGHGKKIFLVAHLDTVFPDGTAACRPFGTEGDIARGPGVSDCKSGVVTIIAALGAVHPDIYTKYEICVLLNSDEEIGSPGSRAFIEATAADAVAVLVAEPAEGETITVSRKGIGRFELRVFGKSAHSGSNYQDGCNAILEMAHKIILIQDCTDLAAGVTLNVGVVQGGFRPNIVPDYAAAEIDLRIRQSGQEAKLIERLRQIALTSQIPGTTGRLDGGITRPPLPVSPRNMHLFESYQSVGRQIGIDLGIFHSGGGSDANFTAALGVPTIDGVGPIGGGHHSDTEYLRIPSLFQRIDLMAAFLNSQLV